MKEKYLEDERKPSVDLSQNVCLSLSISTWLFMVVDDVSNMAVSSSFFMLLFHLSISDERSLRKRYRRPAPDCKSSLHCIT